MIRVLVVDDNAIFRQGMQPARSTRSPDLEVSAVAGDGASGVDAALALQVDIVLMDLAMPGGSAASRPPASSTAAAPHIGVVVMTMLEDDDMVVQALRAGARGYLVKGAAQREILDTIRGVHAGQAVIGSDVARRLAGLVGGSAPEDPFPDLTDREREILDLLAAGASTAQIADRFGLSPKTVRNHLSSIFTKARGARPHPGRAQGARRRVARVTAPPVRSGAMERGSRAQASRRRPSARARPRRQPAHSARQQPRRRPGPRSRPATPTRHAGNRATLAILREPPKTTADMHAQIYGDSAAAHATTPAGLRVQRRPAGRGRLRPRRRHHPRQAGPRAGGPDPVQKFVPAVAGSGSRRR